MSDPAATLTVDLPWMVDLPGTEQAVCAAEILAALRDAAATGAIRPLLLALAAWESTSAAWATPGLAASLLGPDHDLWVDRARTDAAGAHEESLGAEPNAW